MRFIASLVFLFPASAAMAVGPAGPPPWSCSVMAACNAADTCISLHGLPMRFKLSQIEGNTYHLEGYEGFKRAALEFPSLEDATRFAEGYRSVASTPFILIPNNLISDTNSFWLQTIWQRGNGQRFIAEEKMLVSCNSIRK
jgi:hypothetical protein